MSTENHLKTAGLVHLAALADQEDIALIERLKAHLAEKGVTDLKGLDTSTSLRPEAPARCTPKETLAMLKVGCRVKFGMKRKRK